MCVRLQTPREDEEKESDAVETVLMIYNAPNHFALVLPYGPFGANFIT